MICREEGRKETDRSWGAGQGVRKLPSTSLLPSLLSFLNHLLYMPVLPGLFCKSLESSSPPHPTPQGIL